MKNFIRDYFTFNKRERNGVFVLVIIITLLLVWLNISHLFVDKEITDFKKMDELTNQLSAVSSVSSDSSENINSETEFIQKEFIPKVELFYFDPNNLSAEKWKQLGLNDKQIKTLKNYESKGGKFKTKEDVKKIYGISQKLFLTLEPYIQIPESIEKIEIKESQTEKNIFSNREVIKLLEINSADSVQLIKLKGVGAYFASKIIKYRNLLGGYILKEQLMEVWNLDRNKFKEFEQYIEIDESKVKKININNCTVQELKHPYLKWNQINAIVNYRIKHGKYKSVDEIKNTDLVDEETLRKIAPYLIVE